MKIKQVIVVSFLTAEVIPLILHFTESLHAGHHYLLYKILDILAFSFVLPK